MNCVQSMHHIYVNALLLFHVNILRTLSDFSFLFSSGMKRFVSQKWPPCSSLLGTIPDLAEEEIISSLNTSLFVSSPQTWRSISKHALQSCGWKMLISEIISTQLPMCTVVYVLCVVSRLQGDSLSDTRSEEEHRPHVSEQAVPDISCMLHNTAQIQRSYIYVYVFFTFFVVSPALSFSSCLCVLSGSAPLSGVDTVAGQLQECEAMSQVSASVSILPTSIIKQLRSFYSHQLQCRSPPRPLLSREWARRNTSSIFLIGQAKLIHLCVGHSWSCWISDTPIRNLPVSLRSSLRGTCVRS